MNVWKVATSVRSVGRTSRRPMLSTLTPLLTINLIIVNAIRTSCVATAVLGKYLNNVYID